MQKVLLSDSYESDHKKGHPNDRFGFKEAFDTMRQIGAEPEEDEEKPVEVYIHWHQWEGEDVPQPEVNAGAFHASPWAVIAGREVTMGDGLDIGVDEAAALMLWKLTFWGFTQEQIGWKYLLDDEYNR